MNAIKKARLKKGLSQISLAQKVCRSQGHISDLENGRHQASPWLAQKLANELGISIEKVLFPGKK